MFISTDNITLHKVIPGGISYSRFETESTPLQMNAQCVNKPKEYFINISHIQLSATDTSVIRVS